MKALHCTSCGYALGVTRYSRNLRPNYSFNCQNDLCERGIGGPIMVTAADEQDAYDQAAAILIERENEPKPEPDNTASCPFCKDHPALTVYNLHDEFYGMMCSVCQASISVKANNEADAAHQINAAYCPAAV